MQLPNRFVGGHCLSVSTWPEKAEAPVMQRLARLCDGWALRAMIALEWAAYGTTPTGLG